MSDVPNTEPETKAGHPPAVKVGGMRITRHKPGHDKPEPKSDSKEEVEKTEELPKLIMSISGAPVRGDQDFPTSSVKAFHEKSPAPTNEFRPLNKSHAINQPKK